MTWATRSEILMVIALLTAAVRNNYKLTDQDWIMIHNITSRIRS